MSTTDSTTRKLSAKQKVEIIRAHLVDKVPVSELCERYGITPKQYYKRQKQFFANGESAFERGNAGAIREKDRLIETLKSKLSEKDQIIAEIAAENVALKKLLGKAEAEMFAQSGA